MRESHALISCLVYILRYICLMSMYVHMCYVAYSHTYKVLVVVMAVFVLVKGDMSASQGKGSCVSVEGLQ